MKLIAFILSLLFNITPVEKTDLNVYVFIAEECPICNYMGKALSELSENYGEEVSFYAVFPLRNSNYKTVNEFKKKYKMEGYESILDTDQSLTLELGATVTPEVVVTDQNNNILYRGRINDSYYAPGKIRHGSKKNDLKDVLDLALTDKKLPTKWEKAIGCFITFYKN